MAIDEQIGNLQTINGSFSNHGMWKVKAKFLSRHHDPPMAKNDQHGNLITARGPLKKLYLDTYVHRLRNREINREYQDILILKSALWSERLESLKESKTPDWSISDLDKVIKSITKLGRSFAKLRLSWD